MRKIKCKERMMEIWSKVGILALILTLLSAGTAMPVNAQTAESVTKMEDSEETFEDEVTLKNTEGKAASDVAAVKELLEQQKSNGVDVSEYENLNESEFYIWSKDGKLLGLGIHLKGRVTLKEFENIELFNIYGPVTELVINVCPKLGELNCSSGTLRKLDVSGCHNLKILDCSGNRLTKLDIGKLPKLTKLHCYENKLTKLDVSKCPKLTGLYCSFNKLTKLDVSKCPKLTELYCSSNKLTKVDVNKCPKLTKLGCDSNKLTKVDVSKCSKLTDLTCTYNKLTNIDVSKCPKLSQMLCYGNSIKQLDLSKCPKIETIRTDKNVTIPGWHYDSDYGWWERN